MLLEMLVLGSQALRTNLRFEFREAFGEGMDDGYRKEVIVDDETCELDILEGVVNEVYFCMRRALFRGGEGFLCLYAI